MFNIFNNPTYIYFIKEAFMFRNILDILIIASLVFSVIVLFRKTKSTPIIVGLLLLLGLYVISVFLKLPLTESLFQSFFSVFLIILAVIFQKEIRRFFELIGVLGIKRKLTISTDQTLKHVLNSVKYFADHKIGTLIVFPGRENLERHIEGGIILNGKLSEQLLLSIFDDNTPGHDGALVIDGDKVRKFGVHLPLAENIEAVKKFGTRHRAALGLAEVSDSLCVIVSEERGTISVAYQKKLTPIKTVDDLDQILRQFIDEKFPKNKISSAEKWFRVNLTTLGSSLVIAFLIWAVFTLQSSTVQRKYIVPIEFKNTPQGSVVSDAVPQEIEVTLSGKDSDFANVDPNDFKAAVNLAGEKLGWHRVQVLDKNISHPLNTSIVQVDPSNIQIQIIKQ